MVAPALRELQLQLEQAAAKLEPAPNLTFKAMFGGLMGYAQGRPFASLSDVGLALKLPPQLQPALLALAGAKRLQYAPDAPVSKQYLVVPPSLLAAPEDLRVWVEHSVRYVATLPAPGGKKRRQAAAE